MIKALPFLIVAILFNIQYIHANDPKVAVNNYRLHLQKQLEAHFDHMLEHPKAYKKRVKKECSAFPEGDMFPYLFPALSFTNLAIKDPKLKLKAIKHCKPLIKFAIESTEIKMALKPNSLKSLQTYNDHCVYLGQLNLLLGAYQQINPDSEFKGLHNHISKILSQALQKNKAKPLNSFPYLCWPFDSIPVLVSLRLNDKNNKTNHYTSIINKHFNWIDKYGTHHATKLPFSRLDTKDKAIEIPRGCDLSFRLCLIKHLSPLRAKRIYQDYIKHYWLEKGLLSGFAEWPNGKTKFSDMDSGPIINGIGIGATGLGIGTVFAMEDKYRQQKIIANLAAFDLLRPLILSHTSKKQKSVLTGVHTNPNYITGFLFGDATLFYCLTWVNWELSL